MYNTRNHLRTSTSITWTLLGVSNHHLLYRTGPRPSRIPPYLANYLVLQPHHLHMHLHAVRPPLYLLPWWLAVARAAPLERS